MSNNGMVIRQGSKWDFRGAWFARMIQTLLGAGLLWMCKLIYGGVMYLVVTVPPLQASMNKMNERLGQLETNSAEYVKKTELKRDLSEVKNEFTKEMDDQIKKAKLQTKEKLNYAR